MEAFDEKRLIRQLKMLAGGTIYSRGYHYSKQGKVTDITVSDLSRNGRKTLLIEAEVQGSELYYTSLLFDMNQNVFVDEECDCPYADFCKHSVALGIKFASLYSYFLYKEKMSYLEDELTPEHFVRWFNDRGRILSEKTKIKQKQEKQSKTKKEKFEDRYYVSMSRSSYADFQLRDRNVKYQYHYYWDQPNIKKILKNKNLMISDEQKKLLQYIEEFQPSHERQNFSRIMHLLIQSGVDLEVHSYDSNIKIIPIIGEGHITTLTLGIDHEELMFPFYIDQHLNINIVFEMKGDFFDAKKDFYFGNDGVLVLHNNHLTFYEMPLYAIEVLINFYKQGYYLGKEFFKVAIPDEYIISLHSFVEKLSPYFHIEFKDDVHNYEIEERNMRDEVFIVDYDAKKSTMKIVPGIDYGFTLVKIADLVNRVSRHGYTYFESENFDYWRSKYIIKIDKENKKILYTKRSKKQEVNFYKKVCDEHKKFGLTKTARLNVSGDKKIFKAYEKFLEIARSENYKVKFVNDKIEFINKEFKADIKLDLDADNDWLAFDVDYYCGEDQITLEKLKDFIDNKKDFLKTDDGKLVKIENYNELKKFILMLESFYKKEKERGESDTFEGRLYHAPELENIFTKSEYYNAKLNESFEKFMLEAKSGKPVEPVKLKSKFKKILRDYQKEGVDWFHFLRKYRFAGILADDMGLGKTLQTLILIEMNAEKEKPSLVICPKTLIYNWRNEAQKFMPHLKVVVVDGSPKERKESIKNVKSHDLVITSYPSMQKDLDFYKENKIKFNYLILDEAQAIKNHKTKNARTVKQIDADYRIVLTGTPLENSVSDIWSIFDFLMPGFLGSHKNFSERFLNPIMNNGDMNALQDLRKKTSPFMLRRSKGEVLKELPPKTENIYTCKLTKSQNVLYQEILANVKKELSETVTSQGFSKSQIHIFAALMKLRQICNHPTLLLKDKDYTKYTSAKLELFNELIDTILANNGKVLVFSQFTMMLDILKQELKNKGIEYSYLTGQTKNRQDEIDKFNEDKGKSVFLISLKAGGVGLNLTSADNVIIFDPWWNPSVERQAVDRAHRIGQTKSVNVYRLITEGTIEEKIIKLQKRKQNLFDNLVSESKDLFKKLTWDDIQDLLEG